MTYSKETILETIYSLGLDKGEIRRDEYWLNCPFHTEDTPSFSVNLITGDWFCFGGCNGGSLERLVNIFGGDDSKLKTETSQFDIFPKEWYNEVDFNLPEVRFPFTTKGCPKFIRDRGFNEESIKKWEFHHNINTGSLIIPIRDYRKKIVGWVARRNGNLEPRYFFQPTGLETAKLLFGEPYLRDEQDFICICEGQLDAIWLDQHGYNAISLFGAALKAEQKLRLLMLRKGEFVLCFDNDVAGINAAHGYKDNYGVFHYGFIQKMKKYGIISKIEIPEDKKDIQDVRDHKQVVDIIENRELVY